MSHFLIHARHHYKILAFYGVLYVIIEKKRDSFHHFLCLVRANIPSHMILGHVDGMKFLYSDVFFCLYVFWGLFLLTVRDVLPVNSKRVTAGLEVKSCFLLNYFCHCVIMM